MAEKERKALMLRIDLPLWNEIEKWAACEFRSANGQIEYILNEAVRHRKNPRKANTTNKIT